jgi:transglutaminase-like putative cysteine protease
MRSIDTTEERLLPVAEEQPHWAWAAIRWAVTYFEPYLGWSVLLVCMMLAALPALALGENRLAELRQIQSGLDLLGPLAVFSTWFWLGWAGPRRLGRARWLRHLLIGLGLLLTGGVILSQTLVGWLPTLGEIGQAAWTNGWLTLGQQIAGDWAILATRAALWWQGVAAGGAAQDNLVFAALAGLIFWLLGTLTAWLARHYQRGLLAAGPLLWLLGTLLLYSRGGRALMLGGVLLALALHLLLDQHALVQRWQALNLDFSPGVLWDRVVTVLALLALVTIVAALVPNWYIERLVRGYYGWIEPVEAQIETLRDRLFPELRGASRLRGGGALDGMPNEFLLGAGGELGEQIVMLVRTNDSAGYGDYGNPMLEGVTPPGHYMRGVTLATYDGRGWRNPEGQQRLTQGANERWLAEEGPGRKLLVQSVTLLVNSSILFGAPEAIEPGLNYDAQVRAPDDLVALWSRARNYTVVSAIPAVSEAQLAATPAWGAAQPLPPGYELHLQLPETITERTRQLAAQLTAGQATAYAKAQAIETYLRQYEYDLSVIEPPAAVTDVADYFLFDLRKGYCDYYATAFVVLARLAGLPARFATGYAVGDWNPVEQVWVISEAEAHSWPEVYFPDYGWIPFEPTAGRPTLTRIGLPESGSGNFAVAPPAPAAPEAPAEPWNWQLLFWLAPLALLAWGGRWAWMRWRAWREDPWQALLRWGQRAGRPLGAGETVLEYGHGLADHIITRQTREPDTGRVVAREVTALSRAVNTLRYGPTVARTAAVTQLNEHWQRLRSYLARLHIRA